MLVNAFDEILRVLAGSPQLEFSVGRASSGFSDTAWTLGVGSAYLASLQQAAYQPSDGGERLPSGGAIESTQEGLLFSYPSAAGKPSPLAWDCPFAGTHSTKHVSFLSISVLNRPKPARSTRWTVVGCLRR